MDSIFSLLSVPLLSIIGLQSFTSIGWAIDCRIISSACSGWKSLTWFFILQMRLFLFPHGHKNALPHSYRWWYSKSEDILYRKPHMQTNKPRIGLYSLRTAFFDTGFLSFCKGEYDCWIAFQSSNPRLKHPKVAVMWARSEIQAR